LGTVSISAGILKREKYHGGIIILARYIRHFLHQLVFRLPADEPIWLGLDSSGMQRPEAEGSRDRGLIYVPNLPHATKPVSVGWQFSTLMLLPQQPSSWVAILEQRRIRSERTAIEVGIEQLRAVLALIKRPVIVLADRWYAVASFVQA
jgi:hypothetical protein